MARPKRLAGYSYMGVQRYLVTACTRERALHLSDPRAATLVIDAFIETAKEHAFTIVVYCAMPDHIHLLVDGDNDGSDLNAFMKLAKQRAGWRYKHRFGRLLWQEGFYEHVLRDEERTEQVVFYIVANPIRKHMVENVAEYPHWGSTRYTRDELLRAIGLCQI